MGKVYCGICGKRCKGDVLKVHDKFIHKACFLCCCCKIGLDKGGFFLKEEKYYCKNDYLAKFGVKCNVCREIAEGEVIIIFGTTFHLTCFKCTLCRFIFQRGDKVTLSNDEYLCPHCFLRQNSNGTIKKDKSVERLTIKEAEHLPDRDTMTTSMISTVLSDSSEYEPISPEKKPYIDQLSPCLPIQPKMEISAWGDMSTFDDNRSSDSECLSIRTEPETSHHNGIFKKRGMWSYSLGGSTSCLKTTNNIKSPFGRFYNVSYLKIEQQMKESVHPKAIYKQGRSNINTSLSNIQHFHKIDNFSYRSSPNISINRDGYRRPNMSNRLNSLKPNRNGLLSTKPPDTVKQKMSIASLTDIRDAVTLTLGRSNDEITKRTEHVEELDPISASRVPSANYEPLLKTRFDRHTFTSPSRHRFGSKQHEDINRIVNSVSQKNEAIKICSMVQSSEYHFASNKPPLIIAPKQTNLITRSQIICRDSSESDYISVQSFLKTSRLQLSDSRTPKTYSYEQLKISNFSLPKGVDRSRLEIHLTEEEFHKIFKLCRDAFYRLPEWKQNDLKKRVDLF